MEQDESELLALRREKLAALEKLGIAPFGAAFETSGDVAEVREKFSEGATLRVAGVAGTAIDGDRGSLFDPIATGTATDDGVHGFVDLSEQKKSPRSVRDVMKSIPDGSPFIAGEASPTTLSGRGVSRVLDCRPVRCSLGG